MAAFHALMSRFYIHLAQWHFNRIPMREPELMPFGRGE